MADGKGKTFTSRLDNENLWILNREIEDLKETLVRHDQDRLQSVDSITANINRIYNVLQTDVDKKLLIQSYSPIQHLLSVGPLTRTEIPLDLLDLLISEGWNVNSTVHFFSHKMSCLDNAVERRHYNAIRLLVKHGARSNSDVDSSVKPPVISLATQLNVPLDLFDLLATPQDLKWCK